MNDLNQRVINWRRIVRNQPEDFGRLVEMTPISACVLLDRIKDMDYCTIYAVLPYLTATITAYTVRDFDRDGLADLLMAQRGEAGISSYGDEWDMLGWRRVTYPALRRQIK